MASGHHDDGAAKHLDRRHLTTYQRVKIVEFVNLGVEANLCATNECNNRDGLHGRAFERYVIPAMRRSIADHQVDRLHRPIDQTRSHLSITPEIRHRMGTASMLDPIDGEDDTIPHTDTKEPIDTWKD